MKKLLIFVLLLSGSLWAGTCGNGYSYAKKFTVPIYLVPNTDQTNFPVYLAFNGVGFGDILLADLKTVANSGKIQNTANNSISVSGPADLVFCDAASAGNALKYEVATYDATTGAMEAYVKIPTLSHTTPTTFWMFYGNASVSTTQQDLSMWSDASYVAVYHFGSLTADSTGSNALTNTSTTASSSTRESGNSASFNGSASLIASTSTGLGISTLSVETWVNPTSLAANQRAFVADFNPTALQGGFIFRNFGNQFDFIGLTGGGGVYTDRSNNNILATGTWIQLAETVTGTTRLMYANGSSIAYTLFGSAATLSTTVSPIQMGKQSDGNNPYTGFEDEVRVSSVVRSADWLASTYSNQSSPSAFAWMSDVTVGTGPRILQYATCKGSPAVCTFPNNVVAGNLLVAVLSSRDGTACSTFSSNFSDTRSSTFTGLQSSGSGGLVPAIVCTAFATLPSSGTESVTLTQNTVYGEIFEIAGVSSPAADASNGAVNAANTTLSTGSATASTANSIVICSSAGLGTQFSTAFSPSSTLAVNNVALSAANPDAGSAIIQFTGSGSKSCTFTYNAASSQSAAGIGIIKYTPAAIATKRRSSQIY